MKTMSPTWEVSVRLRDDRHAVPGAQHRAQLRACARPDAVIGRSETLQGLPAAAGSLESLGVGGKSGEQSGRPGFQGWLVAPQPLLPQGEVGRRVHPCRPVGGTRSPAGGTQESAPDTAGAEPTSSLSRGWGREQIPTVHFLLHLSMGFISPPRAKPRGTPPRLSREPGTFHLPHPQHIPAPS